MSAVLRKSGVGRARRDAHCVFGSWPVPIGHDQLQGLGDNRPTTRRRQTGGDGRSRRRAAPPWLRWARVATPLMTVTNPGSTVARR